jgi:glycosyltransferase involved in cell wall biosynthesis
MKNISVIIITFNAAATLEKCLSSVADLSDDIVVVDSFSTDNTPAIAGRFTDRFYQQKWLGYSRQKQVALEKTKNDWVLWIDSDEEVSEALKKEIAACDGSRDGYYLNRKTRYLNRWINHCGWSPDYVLRLFRKDRGRFNDAVVHEGIELKGSTNRLTGKLHHYTYRDIRHHIEKMNQFTSLAAEGMAARGKKSGWLKLSFHTVGHFIKTYFIKKGFLDGTAGLIVCILSSCYVFLKYAKLWEMNTSGNTEERSISSDNG